MTTIKFRRDTSANWASVNPIPAQGEPCYETDTGKLKIGNGSDNYVTLTYVSDGGGSSGELPIATATTLGGIKVGNNLSITEDGTLSANAGTAGTTDYTQLENKPQINSVELTGNKTLNDLGIQPKGDYQPAGDYADAVHTHTIADVTNLQTTLDGKQAKITSTNKLNADLIADGTTNKVVTATEKITWNGKQDAIADLATIRSGASKGATSIQPNDNISKLTNDAGYLTEAPIPTNMVTTDTDQTISGSKTFSAQSNFNNGCQFNSSTYSANHFKKGFQIGNIDIYNTTGNILRIGGSSTHFLTFNDNNINFMSSSSTPGMNITDGTITTAYDKPYLKIKEYNDNTNTHNLEINCDTTNNNIWSIACGDQTFINTANIDTTYMKWDGTNKKLKVDTAAVADLAMPSNKHINLTLGASGTKYTAPANGWYQLDKEAGIEGFAYSLLSSNTSGIRSNPSVNSNSRAVLSAFIPVRKNDTIFASYNATGNTKLFSFIYAVGSVPTNTEPEF